ncbi:MULTISPECIES: glycerol-3-phosphate cytidylyltransferase [Vibrio]|uniref:glycerol-3-phosphate cytidylyltransferase n=1 Tax=Vibrio TaxID=662 RepID=UPI0029644398|nr:glycerol-3-phosphate cytidylyltransferase [Vibrio sp. 1401]MDW2326724.1 glycerol-3-phosphate cytidylyltransferase [Vibrio sp. 1401]
MKSVKLKSKKVVLTYGTFDMFHVGHVRLLKRLKTGADMLIVGLSTDEFNRIKGKTSFFSYQERKEILESCRYVDLVVPEERWEQKVDDVTKYSVTTFAIGNDWEGEFDFLKKQCEVKYLERTKDISTTKIKTELAKLNNDKIDDIENQIKIMIDVLRTMSTSDDTCSKITI